ncbi:hypothetical protein [Nocardia sp. NPDC048505]|uniref:hypothetical protein n=1 Tax=unclassified Nocardia TaxID=2637762 RepID=UPI00340437AB
MSTVNVNTTELKAWGSSLTTSASVLSDTSAERIEKNMFGKASNQHGLEAGRNYKAEGEKVYTGLENVYTWLRVWSEAAKALGEAAGSSSIEYGKVDVEAARKTLQQASAV